MIQLTRARNDSAITNGLKGERLEAKNLALLKLKRKKGELASKDFKSSMWKPAKDQLRVESNDKCAYCEADTKIVAHGDVEHFRPKTLYWWLAYCVDNYLYSCQICNQTFKSNKFPVSGERLKGPQVRKSWSDTKLERLSTRLSPDPVDIRSAPTLAAFRRALHAENADLIDPYMEDPAKFLIWIVDDDEKEVLARIKPRVKHRAAKQKALDQVYGLNREELRKVRYQDYRVARSLSRVLDRVEDGRLEDDELAVDVREQLTGMMADDHRFAGMIRYFVVKVWKSDLG
ncbi:hypothetical protein OAX78_03015 [Planctomycetota bacterium]|nr:hypothetical protein [Planctomycetota bacterium]